MRIVQLARPYDVYREPVDLGVARFVGEAVEIPARVCGDGIVACALGDVHVLSHSGGAEAPVVLSGPSSWPSSTSEP